MVKIILVGIGGFFGSACRYIITGLIQKVPLLETFPWGTFAVNIGGCFLIGLLSGFVEDRQFFSPETRLFVFIGFLGGFTTFSTFGLETYSFLQDGQWLSGIFNIGSQIGIGLLAVWAGYIGSQLI